MTDFMTPVEVLQMVVTEFVSPHQPRPIFAAMVMGEVGESSGGMGYLSSSSVYVVDLLIVAGTQAGGPSD